MQPLEQLYPLYFPPALWLNLVSVSAALPQPPGQTALLRFTSGSVWPRPWLSSPTPNQSPFRTTSHLSVSADSKQAFGVPACSAWRAAAGLYLHSVCQCYCTATNIRYSVLGRFRKLNVCFIDSLSSLTQTVSLCISLSISCFNSISLALSLLLQRQRVKSFLSVTPTLGMGIWVGQSVQSLWYRLKYPKKYLMDYHEVLHRFSQCPGS